MTRVVIAAVVAAAIASRPAAADDDDPRVLFAEGRFAAAADVFEHRWRASGDAVDGVNAVVSWRTAGRYARAASLLAHVVGAKRPPTGDALATATELAERLAVLTATATIAGAPRGITVRIDADPAELVGDAIVLDVGEHDVVIDQETCESFVWHAVAYPGARLVVPYAPRCERNGTLHVYLDGDPGATFRVDGREHAVANREADLALAPGAHRLAVTELARPVLDEPIAIESRQTKEIRVRFPWRARRFGVVLALTGATRAGQVMNGIGSALTIGVWGSRFRATLDGGSMISDTPGLQPVPAAPGHPWFGATLAVHVTRRPLWHGKLGPYRLALDIDPVAVRFDEYRAISYFGFRTADSIEARVRAWSFLPIALAADGPFPHIEMTLWPISYAEYHQATGGVAVQPGVSAFGTLLFGWRL